MMKKKYHFLSFLGTVISRFLHLMTLSRALVVDMQGVFSSVHVSVYFNSMDN